MTNKIHDFYLYSFGLCCACVCTTLTPEEALTRLNREHPTGISNDWQLSKDPTFASGDPNPCPCNSHPETHKHYLFEC